MVEWLERNFDRIYILLLFLVAIGSVMDGHDHANGGIETIYTIGHTFAYGAIGSIAGLFAALILTRYKEGMGLKESIPDGYQLTVYALPLFFLGGLGDMIWHTFFGLETKVTEIASPTHLAILSFGSFIASGPLRRAWYRGVEKNWSSQFIMLSSAAFVLSLMDYLMIILHPYTEPYAASWYAGAFETFSTRIGIAGLVMSSIVLMGVLLLLIERFDLVRGAFTYILTINVLLITYVNSKYVLIPMGIVTGLAADVLYNKLKPGTENVRNFRLFAFLVPVVFVSMYYLTIGLTGQIVWNVHEWAGTIPFAGLGGLITSYVIYPSKRELSNGVNTD